MEAIDFYNAFSLPFTVAFTSLSDSFQITTQAVNPKLHFLQFIKILSSYIYKKLDLGFSD